MYLLTRLILSCLLMIIVFSCQMQDEIIDDVPDTGIMLKDASVPLWETAFPTDWNTLTERNLLVYAHGLVFPDQPLGLPKDSVGGVPVKEMIVGMKWAYAASSYEANGLVANKAVENIKQLVADVKTQMTENGLLPPTHWFIGGPSEGGLVTVLTLEKYPELFDGGISVCGPIGCFYDQCQFIGDFNVLFNYLFSSPGIGDPSFVDQSVRNNWNTGVLKTTLANLMMTNPGLTAQLIKTSKATVNLTDPVKKMEELMLLLKYDVLMTQHVNDLLQGCIYNNKKPYRFYFGSANDIMLNKGIQRILLSPGYETAKANLASFETTGNIQDPLVTLHTTGDFLVPAWHQTLYRAKVWSKGKALYYTGIPVVAYGHCTISEQDLKNGIAVLLAKVKIREALAGL